MRVDRKEFDIPDFKEIARKAIDEINRYRPALPTRLSTPSYPVRQAFRNISFTCELILACPSLRELMATTREDIFLRKSLLPWRYQIRFSSNVVSIRNRYPSPPKASSYEHWLEDGVDIHFLDHIDHIDPGFTRHLAKLTSKKIVRLASRVPVAFANF